MGFVQAAMLTALAAVILPIVAHLIFRRRSRPVSLGTLRFLKVAVRHDTRRRKLKRWLLLAMRVSCVVLLALLFARPFRAAEVGGSGSGLTVILIDRSASMDRKRDGERLVEHALKTLPEIVKGVPARARVEVAWFDSKVEAVPSEDGKVSLSNLKAPEQLVGGTDFAAALTWAGSRCEAARGGGPLAVHVVSDLQRSGFGSLDTMAFPKDVPVKVWDVGPASIANVAITDVRPAGLMVRADQPTTVQAQVLNARLEPLSARAVRLTLTNKGKTFTLPGVASAAPGATATVTFETPPLGAGLWQGTVSVAGDDGGLAADDVRHVAVFAAAKPRVLLLDGAARDVAALGEAYFLERALGLAPPGETVPDAPFRLNVFPYGPEARLPDLREMDVLVAANVGGFAATDAAKVKAFLDRGGSAVVFGGGNLTAQSNGGYEAAGLSVGAIAGSHPARDTPFRVAEFDAVHPVLVAFADPQHGDLRRIAFAGCTRVKPTDGVRTLASFGDGTPILLERQEGASRVLWFGASVGREHGEWSRGRLFLPLVHQLVRGAAGQTGAGPVRDLPAAGEAPGVSADGPNWVVRNLESQESDLEACSADEWAKRLGVTLATDTATAADEKKAVDGLELRAGELWPWMWLLVLVCWLAEGLLANRTVA